MKKILIISCFGILIFIFLILIRFKSDNHYPVYQVVGYNNNIIYKEGTAFVYKIDDYAYLLTNYHVVENCDLIYVIIDDKKVKADLLNYDEYEDVAILYLDSNFVESFLDLDDNYDYNVGNPLSVITSNSVLSGKVLSEVYPFKIHYNYNYKMLDLFKLDSKVVDGHSGSPILSNNKVIGMVSMVELSSNNSFAIPSNNLVSIISNLESDNNSIINLGIDYSDYDGLFSGVRIDNVYDDLLAYNFGLASGDIIIGIDDNVINDALELNYYLSKIKNKDSFLIKYYRDGSYYESIIYYDS